jgi:ComF family protein
MADPKPTLRQRLLQLLFPSRCASCGQRGEWLCTSCLALVQFHFAPWPVEIREISPLSGVRSAARFSGPMRRAVHHFKYRGLRALAPTLGQMLWDSWRQDPYPVDVIVPVPLHSSRLRHRGYNQSALLAHELARHSGLPVMDRTLVRRIATPPQVGLTARERALNVHGAFACEEGTLRGLAIVLIDDVMTTGATLRSCGQEVLRAGASRVYGFTLTGEVGPGQGAALGDRLPEHLGF